MNNYGLVVSKIFYLMYVLSKGGILRLILLDFVFCVGFYL